jgi:hypothetical protein
LTRGNRALFLINIGEGLLIDATEGAGIVLNGNVETTGFADIDNDGDLDLMVGSPSRFFMNDGRGRFVDRTEEIDQGNDTVPVVFADYNLDGAVDGYSWDAFQINSGNSNHWLRVELVGIQSNRNGIGARIFATTGDLRQMQEILGGRGFGQDELVAHFGLGEQVQVDQLEVYWPSGQVDTLTGIPADQKIRLFEGGPGFHKVEPTLWTGSDLDGGKRIGTHFLLEAIVRPALFAPEARIVSVSADLSALGGSAALPLTDLGDGRFGLETELDIDGENGVHHMDFLIEEETLLGPHWIRLSRGMEVWPGKDLEIFADGQATDWSISSEDEVHFDLLETDTVYAGQAAQVLITPSFWRVDYTPQRPVNTAGYKTLHLAFHPGESTAPQSASFSILVNRKLLHLVRRPTLTGIEFDTERREWQTVEIPLDWFEVEQIETIRLTGNIEGRFYLDDFRIVATSPLASTAVMESFDETQPQDFVLEQNFPNPFNSSTIIRFALPADGAVELAVYNLAGQKVAALVDGERPTGAYAVRWDGQDDAGRSLASGLYLYRIKADDYEQTRKLLLVR